MAGTPRTPTSENTIQLIRSEVLPKLVEMQGKIDVTNTKLEYMEKAVEVANEGMETRLEGMNEFRNTLKDQASRFVTRDELKSEINALCTQLEELKKFKNTLEGKASQSQVNIALAFSLIGLVITIIKLFF